MNLSVIYIYLRSNGKYLWQIYAQDWEDDGKGEVEGEGESRGCFRVRM